MTAKWWWHVLRLARKLWVRAALFSLLGIATAFASIALKGYIPSSLSTKIGAGAVDDVLTIIASSMLAVTTFTLSIMVQAYGAAASQATPRATTLLIEDPTTQNVLATFLGSFLFALVGIVALHAGAYGDKGRVILFGVTILVISAITISLIQWFNKLTTFGRLISTASTVENAARNTIGRWTDYPNLGCRPLRNAAVDVPPHAHMIHCDDVGYVQHVDASALQSVADHTDAQVYLLAQPGTFVDPSQPLAAVAGPTPASISEEDMARVRRAFTVGATRTFDQDVRFGLVVLSEIASRAMSPAVNDPGTAIDIITRLQRLLTIWQQGRQSSKDDADGNDAIAYPSVHTPALSASDLFNDAFRAIGRDGAGTIEVVERLLKTLAALEKLGDGQFADAARAQTEMLIARANLALDCDADLASLKQLATTSDSPSKTAAR
ncbi:MAG: DUF2254 domain-containing protein [Hyphomicrobiaceae bacterium]|nr:DUF2254 domain-containing protein [Hyphomicrobiaceae bacterium]